MGRPPKGEPRPPALRYVLLKWGSLTDRVAQGWTVVGTFEGPTRAYAKALKTDGEYVVVNAVIGFVSAFHVRNNWMDKTERVARAGFYLMNQGGHSNRCNWVVAAPPCLPLNWVYLVLVQGEVVRAITEAETRTFSAYIGSGMRASTD